MIFLLHAKAQRRKGSLFIFLKNFNSYSYSATPQRLRDLESKVLVENLSTSGVARQSNQVSPKELQQPNVDSVIFPQESHFSTQVLDVTQIPILEEYC
jgi:hypothetical protein